MTQDVERLRRLDNELVWHPFTAMSAYRDENAPIIVEADGFHLIDSEGRRYLDGHSSLWCNIHGHRVPEIDHAIRSQLDRVAHSTLLGLSNVPSIELAAELVQVVPAGLNKVFYSDCGAAGVEVALKIAFQYYQQRSSQRDRPVRDQFLHFEGAYHGDTIGTMSIGSISQFKTRYSPLLFPALWAKIPRAIADDPDHEAMELKLRCQEFEQILEEHHESIAGVVIEPLVQAAAGISLQAPGFLRRVREITRKFDVLLIADEIAVGFGRTGSLFACEQESVSPDILVLSKGLTGGYMPLAATLVTDEIYDAFLGEMSSGRTFYHGHTYTGNPLACSAALASLRLIQANRVLENARHLEETLQGELASLKSIPHVGAIRQKGTMVGIELSMDPSSRPGHVRAGHQVTLACRERGVVLRNIADVIVLMPAPAMPAALAVELCQVVRESIVDLFSD